jgi:hypothetical protein
MNKRLLALVAYPHQERFMPRVLCTLQNAAAEISGVQFDPVDGGLLSAEISDEQAEAFLSIPGYAAHQDDPEEDARLKAEAAAEAQREADAAAANLKATKAPAKAAKTAKADPLAPVAAANDDDTTF